MTRANNTAACTAVTAALCLLIAHAMPAHAAAQPATPAPSSGVAISLYNNTALAGDPWNTVTEPTLVFTAPVDPSSPAMSLEALASLAFPAQQPHSGYMGPTPATAAMRQFNFSCTWSGATHAFLWVDGHMVCQMGPYGTAAYEPYVLQLSKNEGLAVVMHVMYDGAAPTPAGIGVNVTWTESTYAYHGKAVHGTSPAMVPIPTSLLTPSLSGPEQTRRALQRSMQVGWGMWMHASISDVVLLPEAARMTLAVCRISTGACLQSTTIDKPPKGTTVRVGPHANDRSYAQYYVSYGDVNVSVSVCGNQAPGTATDALMLTVELESCAANCDDYALAVLARGFVWHRAGMTTVSANTITYAAHNLRTVTAYVTQGASTTPQPPTLVKLPPSAVQSPYVAVSLSAAAGPIAVTTGTAQAVPDVQTAVATRRAAELAKYANYGPLAEVKEAIQAGVMWNVVYLPAEAGPFAPVARGWDFAPSGTDSDWGYVIFDWDNFFASYLLSVDAKELAYSNIIQTVKSKTAAGFVPNYAAATIKSYDRTEPPVGAKVLLELYRKWGDDWLVELLLDDLVDWHDWFWRARLLQPLGLVALGSTPHGSFSDGGIGAMQGARYESGLDNSPMYDGDFYSTATHLMSLFDVGMSSMAVSDADAVVDLAAAAGRADVAKRVKADADAMRALITAHLWDDQGGTYTNRFPNGTFYRRISPTSFYSMLAGAATDAQAVAMVNGWLTNASRFCINPAFPVGSNNTCYWGLPSISADDPAYPPLGYWRGYVWGPMAQLTYWSLQQYDHVPAVRAGRKALCTQMTAMFVNQWRRNRHVCENFCPHMDGAQCGGDCTGGECAVRSGWARVHAALPAAGALAVQCARSAAGCVPCVARNLQHVTSGADTTSARACRCDCAVTQCAPIAPAPTATAQQQLYNNDRVVYPDHFYHWGALTGMVSLVEQGWWNRTQSAALL